jgi:uncharacterized RDD family membrane protein YckC
VIRSAIFWLVAILWVVFALPILLWSLATLQVPVWPEFSSHSTVEGITVWAAMAALLYVAPIVLWINRKSAKLPSKKMVADAKN